MSKFSRKNLSNLLHKEIISNFSVFIVLLCAAAWILYRDISTLTRTVTFSEVFYGYTFLRLMIFLLFLIYIIGETAARLKYSERFLKKCHIAFVAVSALLLVGSIYRAFTYPHGGLTPSPEPSEEQVIEYGREASRDLRQFEKQITEYKALLKKEQNSSVNKD